MSHPLPAVRESKEQELLMSFLESRACPDHSMNFYQLDGYLRAICCGPGPAEPDDWLPLVFNDGQPKYQGKLEAELVNSAILNLYNFHAEQVLSASCDLPCPSVYQVIRADRINLEQWARGFMQGYIFREDSWNALLGKDAADQQLWSDELDGVLYVIAAVADVDLAVQQGVCADELGDIFASLPEFIIKCGRIGRVLSGSL